MFEFCIRPAAPVAAAVERTRNGLSGWAQAAVQGLHPIRELRQRLLLDDDATRLIQKFGLAWAPEFEARSIASRWGCIHGDFHGGNILVSQAGEPAVIDYGDVADGPLALDPVSLEFSVFFHPNGPCRGSAWPSKDQANRWFDLESYLLGSPCPDFVRQCRSWAVASVAGDRELAACAYSYLLRQLKYEGTDSERAPHLIDGAKALFDRT